MNGDNKNTAIAVIEDWQDILPRDIDAQINKAINMRNTLNKIFERVLEPGKDYDRIPGTDKPTLLKAGAEMLCKIFKLAQGKADVLDKNEDWEKGIFSYTLGVPLIHIDSGFQVSYGAGAANSMEKKHRYRRMKRDGKDIQIENPDPADLQNTLIKMANKRALVDAVLKATGASRMFTQDMEEFREMTGQFEKASTKQRDFIKRLFGNMSEPDALTEISRICKRNVKSFDDISRSEATQIIDAKKSEAQSKSYNNDDYAAGYDPAPAGDDSHYSDYYADSQGSSINRNGKVSGTENSGGGFICADCGAAITRAENGYSSSKFGRPLCRNCQNTAKQSA